MSYRDYKTVVEQKDLPKGDHYVILEFDTYGYNDQYDEFAGPGAYRTANKVNYLAYESKARWEDEIKARSTKSASWTTSAKWVALVVRQPKITVTVDVGIEE